MIGKSSGRLVSLFFGAVCVFVFGVVCLSVFFGALLCLLCLSSRSSLKPPGGRPRTRLKESTPHEAPTPALTANTLAPANSDSGQCEDHGNTESSDLQTVAKREDCAALEALYQHREATSHTSSQAGA